MGFTNKDKLCYHRHSDEKEAVMCFLRISGPKAACFHGLKEIPQDRVCQFAGTIMENWGIPFFIYEHLKSFLHFQISPAFFVELHVKLNTLIAVKISSQHESNSSRQHSWASGAVKRSFVIAEIFSFFNHIQ
jgi:hypothetical protein